MVANMDDDDANACMSAFGKFYKEAGAQWINQQRRIPILGVWAWLKAAIQEVSKVIQLRQSGISIDLSAQLAANRAAYQ